MQEFFFISKFRVHPPERLEAEFSRRFLFIEVDDDAVLCTLLSAMLAPLTTSLTKEIYLTWDMLIAG